MDTLSATMEQIVINEVLITPITNYLFEQDGFNYIFTFNEPFEKDSIYRLKLKIRKNYSGSWLGIRLLGAGFEQGIFNKEFNKECLDPSWLFDDNKINNYNDWFNEIQITFTPTSNNYNKLSFYFETWGWSDNDVSYLTGNYPIIEFQDLYKLNNAVGNTLPSTLIKIGLQAPPKADIIINGQSFKMFNTGTFEYDNTWNSIDSICIAPPYINTIVKGESPNEWLQNINNQCITIERDYVNEEISFQEAINEYENIQNKIQEYFGARKEIGDLPEPIYIDYMYPSTI